MHAFLVSDEENLKDILPPSTPDQIWEIRPKLSIGIDDIRQATSFLFRKSTSQHPNLLIIYDAEKLTIPAQNAFLKTLEEPPGNSQIYLVTSQPNLLLPTVLSRLQLLTCLPAGKSLVSSDLSDLVVQFVQSDLTQKIFILDKQSFDRQQALEFIDALENHLHTHISQISPNFSYSSIFQTRKLLTSNVSVRACLDWLCFEL